MQTNRLTTAEPLPFTISPSVIERMGVLHIIEARERLRDRQVTKVEPLPLTFTAQQIERMRVLHVIEARESLRASQYAAAKRALSIANKLKNPDSKKYHRSRIFGAMNKLRAAV